MFSPTGMYGFAADPEGREVFFHAQDFHRLAPGGPPPVVGEVIRVEGIDPGRGNRPRASSVYRASTQELKRGLVKSFDPKKGWGFVTHSIGEAFLHASELMEGWIPVIGTPVDFYLGLRKEKPRACWVRPSEIVGKVTFQGGIHVG